MRSTLSWPLLRAALSNALTLCAPCVPLVLLAMQRSGRLAACRQHNNCNQHVACSFVGHLMSQEGWVEHGFQTPSANGTEPRYTSGTIATHHRLGPICV
jgi:hypothetical protein